MQLHIGSALVNFQYSKMEFDAIFKWNWNKIGNHELQRLMNNICEGVI